MNLKKKLFLSPTLPSLAGVFLSPRSERYLSLVRNGSAFDGDFDLFLCSAHTSMDIEKEVPCAPRELDTVHGMGEHQRSESCRSIFRSVQHSLFLANREAVDGRRHAPLLFLLLENTTWLTPGTGWAAARFHLENKELHISAAFDFFLACLCWPHESASFPALWKNSMTNLN